MSQFVLRQAVDSIKRDPALSAGMEAAALRRGAFPTAEAMELAGAAMIPSAKAVVDQRLDSFWRSNTGGFVPDRAPEVIIGGGVHAAIYAASRVASGFPRPVVLERSKRVGGAFAVSMAPSFYLNSSNKPGQFGLPGQDGGLNYLPGAPVQPDLLSGREYQTNADIAYAVRAALAMYADVYTGCDVTFISYTGLIQYTCGGVSREIQAGRVIDARGLGDPSFPDMKPDGISVQTFPQFMASMDQMFPLQNLDRVAVIGGGDSGKVAVEALLGIGPNANSLTGLDYVSGIDWYARTLPQFCEDWRERERGRYARIGTYLPRANREEMTDDYGDTVTETRGDARDPGARVRVIRANGTAVPTLGGALVGSRPYSRAIVCTGNTLPALGMSPGDFSTVPGDLARTYAGENIVYRVGPAAELPYTREESDEQYARRPDNRVAIFRLAPRTAALACTLGEPVNRFAAYR